MKLLTLVFLVTLFSGVIIQSDLSLIDSNWSLISIENLTTKHIQYSDTMCRGSLHFGNDGKYDGYGGWNWYGGHYSISKENKLLMDNPIRTLRGGSRECEWGEALCGYYQSTRQYVVTSDSLILWTDSIKITFAKTN